MKLSLTPPLKRSHWLQETSFADDAMTRLQHTEEADVAIIGGGFVGLWTALSIKEQAPDCKVVILEQDVCGGGASGRNGGFVMSWWPKVASLRKFCSAEQALFLAQSSENAISELGQFCQQHGIDAHFTQKGWIWTATTAAHIDTWQDTMAACEQLGAQPFEVLDAADVAKRTGSHKHLAGIFEQSNATVQPGLLVRGMRRVALEQGVLVYEQSGVSEIQTGTTATLLTAQGKVLAKQVVLASNAWAACVPSLQQAMVPVNSSIVLTEAMPETLADIGWEGEEALIDSQLMVNYYRTTKDGRIAFGKGTGAITYGSTIGPLFSEDAACIDLTEQHFRMTYPQLSHIRTVQAWSGPIDRTYDSLPIFGQLAGHSNIHYSIGWSGNGVGPSRIGGRILASLALGKQDQWSTCALVNRHYQKFPPEPLRYWGGKAVRLAVMKKEQAEMQGATAPRLALWLAGFAPSGLEDKA